MFGSLKNLFGKHTWSVLFILNNTNPIYALHDESAVRMLKYLGGYFERDFLRAGWTVMLQHNASKKQIPVEKAHFKNQGNDIALALLNQIEICESITKPKGEGPIFIEIASKKKIPIPSPEEQQKELMRTENSFMKVKKKLSFYTIMNDQVFHPGG